ncbi:hypothetical protein AVEN_113474-1 [Araneus ventricosus]|uniref:Mutator-like transposase domain-containing protein n=1 Tax=Araneus ventricosus TaxID=182803 RepID=A0A4Y2KLQ1_ARAVE|nr:hypothetical protein AVEN_113474-1 [Araneus ventricosus]
MCEAAGDINKNNSDISQSRVSFDGTWQNRGHTSLNGCVSAISVDSGKVLYIEVMSKMRRTCNSSSNRAQDCFKNIGSSCSMEVLGVYRMFERSEKMRNLQYVKYFGIGDSKNYDNVKEI